MTKFIIFFGSKIYFFLLKILSKKKSINWFESFSRSSQWQIALVSKKNKKILIPTSVGGHSIATSVEGMLGAALTLRGGDVAYLLCDGILPACLHMNVHKNFELLKNNYFKEKKKICSSCFNSGVNAYKSSGLKIHRFSDYVSPSFVNKTSVFAGKIAFSDIRSLKTKHSNLGEQAYAGALRFFARGDLPQNPHHKIILKRYLAAAMITEEVSKNILNSFKPDTTVFHHGIYVPQGIIGDVFRKNNIRVSNWTVAYKKKCFIFSHNNSYHYTLLEEPTNKWNEIKWTNKLEKKTLNYLHSRRSGKDDWIWFHSKPENDYDAICRELGINPDVPFVTLLTNVFWDAQLHFKANFFKSMLDWVLKTIEIFSKKQNIQLIIRIHPAEISGTLVSRQLIFNEIIKIFPELPKNIFIVKPESNISTYVLCERSNAVLIYGTKMGVEIAALGIPVIVAGEAWVKNKGITIDAKSYVNYKKILNQLPFYSQMNKNKTKLAQMYAYHFFFRRFIPLNFVKSKNNDSKFSFEIDSLNQLMPGSDKGLDVICSGILDNKDYIYPEEEFQ